MCNHDLEGKGFYFDRYRSDICCRDVLEFKQDVYRTLTITDIVSYSYKIMNWYNIPVINFLANRHKIAYIPSHWLEKENIKFKHHLAGFDNLYEIRKK